MIWTGIWLVATATVAAVLVISGVLKVAQPQAVDRAFTDLQVPSALQATWIRRSFPWLETALGAILLAVSGPVLILAAAIAVAVFGAYMVLISRAAASDKTVQCNCFGAASSSPVTGWTVLRNIGLLLAAVVVLAGALSGFSSWWGVAGSNSALLMAPVPALAVMGLIWKDHTVSTQDSTEGSSTPHMPAPHQGRAHASGPVATTEDNDDEYTREPIPRYALSRGRSETVPMVTLHQLVVTGPVLLVRLNPGCGSCEVVASQWQDYQDRMGSTVRMLPVFPAGAAPARVLGDLDPSEYLYDDHMALDGLFEVGGTPWAVLLGADGWLAGGPELGQAGIEQMITEIQEVLGGLPDPADQPPA